MALILGAATRRPPPALLLSALVANSAAGAAPALRAPVLSSRRRAISATVTATAPTPSTSAATTAATAVVGVTAGRHCGCAGGHTLRNCRCASCTAAAAARRTPNYALQSRWCSALPAARRIAQRANFTTSSARGTLLFFLFSRL